MIFVFCFCVFCCSSFYSESVRQDNEFNALSVIVVKQTKTNTETQKGKKPPFFTKAKHMTKSP